LNLRRALRIWSQGRESRAASFVTVNPFSSEVSQGAKSFIDCNADSCNRYSGNNAHGSSG
jgi:hypothetical protein